MNRTTSAIQRRNTACCQCDLVGMTLTPTAFNDKDNNHSSNKKNNDNNNNNNNNNNNDINNKNDNNTSRKKLTKQRPVGTNRTSSPKAAKRRSSCKRSSRGVGDSQRNCLCQYNVCWTIPAP